MTKTTWTTIHPTSDKKERISDFAWAGGRWWTVSTLGHIRQTDGHKVLSSLQLTVRMGGVHLRCIEMLPDASMGWIGVLRKNDLRVSRLWQYTAVAGWKPVSNLPQNPSDGICGLKLAGQTVFALGTYQEEEPYPPGLWRCQLGVDPNKWTALNPQTSMNNLELRQLTDLHFWTDKEGIIVGGARNALGEYQPTILRTHDSGQTWAPVPLPPLPPPADKPPPKGRYAWKVYFVNDDLGFVSISTYGGGLDRQAFILKTTDRGQTWTPLSIPVPKKWSAVKSANLRGVGFIDEKRGWACGHESPLIETTDGGLSWKLARASIVHANRFAKVGKDIYVAGNGFFRGS